MPAIDALRIVFETADERLLDDFEREVTHQRRRWRIALANAYFRSKAYAWRKIATNVMDRPTDAFLEAEEIAQLALSYVDRWRERALAHEATAA